MKPNMGTIDRALRVLLAAVAIILIAGNWITGTLAIVAVALAAVFTLTSLLSFCPLYLPFGLSTRGKEKN